MQACPALPLKVAVILPVSGQNRSYHFVVIHYLANARPILTHPKPAVRNPITHHFEFLGPHLSPLVIAGLAVVPTLLNALGAGAIDSLNTLKNLVSSVQTGLREYREFLAGTSSTRSFTISSPVTGSAARASAIEPSSNTPLTLPYRSWPPMHAPTTSVFKMSISSSHFQEAYQQQYTIQSLLKCWIQ
ncbi:hypothetical protein BC830DRAFT_1157956 [Chytriomyces sp. MP71]|nr:hypothetical protein BC830DRAFT_1157956 [Chytriomyces sp. MP71]